MVHSCFDAGLEFRPLRLYGDSAIGFLEALFVQMYTRIFFRDKTSTRSAMTGTSWPLASPSGIAALLAPAPRITTWGLPLRTWFISCSIETCESLATNKPLTHWSLLLVRFKYLNLDLEVNSGSSYHYVESDFVQFKRNFRSQTRAWLGDRRPCA